MTTLTTLRQWLARVHGLRGPRHPLLLPLLLACMLPLLVASQAVRPAPAVAGSISAVVIDNSRIAMRPTPSPSPSSDNDNPTVHEQEVLDEALEETFPSSDPIAVNITREEPAVKPATDPAADPHQRAQRARH